MMAAPAPAPAIQLEQMDNLVTKNTIVCALDTINGCAMCSVDWAFYRGVLLKHQENLGIKLFKFYCMLTEGIVPYIKMDIDWNAVPIEMYRNILLILEDHWTGPKFSEKTIKNNSGFVEQAPRIIRDAFPKLPDTKAKLNLAIADINIMQNVVYECIRIINKCLGPNLPALPQIITCGDEDSDEDILYYIHVDGVKQVRLRKYNYTINDLFCIYTILQNDFPRFELINLNETLSHEYLL